MKHLRRYMAALLWIGVGSVPAAALAEVVSKVEVSGNRRIEADAIRERMKLKDGVEITPEKVREDILSIFSMGFFEDVRVEEDAGKLIVAVRERPVISEIKYQGSDEFETKDLEEASGLKTFNVVNLAKIRQAQTAIAKKYEEKGYYLARADYELKPIEGKPNEVQLIFNVTENEKVRIRKIFFLGNKVFTSNELKKFMMTSEGNAASWATNGGTYREGAFERDLSALAFFYGNEGYIEAKFAKPRVTLSQDRRYVDIFIDVDEGKQFFLGDVSFRGDLLFTQEDLRASFGMKEKDVFSTGKLQEEVLKLTDKYGDEGYAFANVIPRTQIREGTQIVDLSFDVEKGEKVYWGKISVTGNSKTHDKVVRRELQFNEGELYNATKRKKSLERIRRLGFFGSDVNFLTSTPPGSTNILNLEIRVSEKPTGSLNVSAGWGSVAGFTFGAQISQNNLSGLGQQLSLNLQFQSTGARNFDLSFTDPHIFDTNWLGGGDLYALEQPIGYVPTTYTQKKIGTDIKFGREIFEQVSVFGTYKIERARLTNPINPAVYSSPLDQDSLISSVASSISYDTRDNRLDPSNGYYTSASAEFAGLGGRTFQKYVAWFRMYKRLGWKFVYRANLEYGVLTNIFNNDPVPDTERFVLGGIFSLRGYQASSVGTTLYLPDTRLNSNGVTYESPNPSPAPGAPPYNPQSVAIPIGGTHKLIFNNELEFPLIPDANIRAVLFLDAGNSWTSSNDLKPVVLLVDAGWGIRWYSPLGPLRFEWGYPLGTKIPTSQDSPVFNFIIAPTF